MKTLLVEGWRHIPHSYAMVNQHYCLEMLRRGDVRLFHRDVPFAFAAWRPTSGLFSAEHEAQLRAIPAPPPELRPDAVLRIGWPHFFHADPGAARTFVWGTSETRSIDALAIGVKRPPAEVLPKTEADIIACSNWAASGFVNSGVPASRVSVVPCGIDPRVFHPIAAEERAAVRRQLGWEGKFVILNISAMTANKGIAYLLKAAAHLIARVPNTLIVLKGADALYNSQQQARNAFGFLTPAEAQAISPRTAYTGNTLATHALARFYQAADVYVSPYVAEGFNLPVLEAAACGLPVICTAGGSTDDFVDDSFALRIDSDLREVPPGSGTWLVVPRLEHLASLLSRAADDGEFRRRAGEAGPEWARTRFSWERSTELLLQAMFPDGAGGGEPISAR